MKEGERRGKGGDEGEGKRGREEKRGEAWWIEKLPKCGLVTLEIFRKASYFPVCVFRFPPSSSLIWYSMGKSSKDDHCGKDLERSR